MPGNMRRDDPFLSFRFRVEINGIERGGFTEVSGLQAEVEVFEYREGGVNEYIHKLAGPVRYASNLVLKHGLMDADRLWQWERELLHGIIDRTNVSIILTDEAGCSEPSSGRLYTVDKHGYTDWVPIPWPRTAAAPLVPGAAGPGRSASGP